MNDKNDVEDKYKINVEDDDQKIENNELLGKKIKPLNNSILKPSLEVKNEIENKEVPIINKKKNTKK